MQQKKGFRTRVLLVAAMALVIVSVTLASLWLVRNLQHYGCESALYLRFVCPITAALRGLRCHPLTCMLLKVRLSVDSSPT